MASSIPLASGASIPMPPGYKFIPSDEDTVVLYLRCRALNQPLPSAFITDKDILNHNPWDLIPGHYSTHLLCVLSWKGTCWSAYHWVMDEYRLAGAGLSPYRVLTPSTNNNIEQRSCITDVAGKKHDDPVDALRGTTPIIENTPILLNPDESWAVCRIHKTRKRTSHVVIGSSSCPGEQNIPFFDFLGLGNHDQGSANKSTQAGSLMEVENSEVEGDRGTSEIANTSNGN
ncbi:hypothetical protein PR202_gb12936 [Eleusine coracana subsp. coracana]|uniref:NAC domain-containing protein n=1 Tax=Eleusine coracana subsp. coracana TaxID=191504 RepID=A0AAV5ER82_ELECO|nr:hypothetical protein PR202_gb12936 [Eleusine coracana subsp. coracana]